MFIIKNLSVSVEQKTIIHDLSLTCNPGTVHVIMGPNGSGKSTLSLALLGHPKYTVTDGKVYINQESLLDLPLYKRVQAGLFVGFQYPQEIPGVKMVVFLHEIYNALHATTVTLSDFKIKILYPLLDLLAIDHSFIYRDLNDGFSGGEKKRFELLQLLLSSAKIAILDEIDSGLDIDALKLVVKAIAYLREKNPSLILILITHYNKITELVQADYVYVLKSGAIVAQGSTALIERIATQGYDAFI